jgi:hypothetical protein
MAFSRTNLCPNCVWARNRASSISSLSCLLGTAVSVKAVSTTAAALQESNKVWAEERRSSAMASVLNQRRNSVFSDTKESPGKVRDADNMKDSFRIWFENSERQHQLSAHHDIEQSFCVISGWKVLAQNIFLLKCGKDSGVNSIPHHICTEYFATKNLV